MLGCSLLAAQPVAPLVASRFLVSTLINDDISLFESTNIQLVLYDTVNRNKVSIH
jgi:hypothetical protein